jgi:hypothetical protein
MLDTLAQESLGGGYGLDRLGPGPTPLPQRDPEMQSFKEKHRRQRQDRERHQEFDEREPTCPLS